MSRAPLIEIRGLLRAFPGPEGTRPVLRGVDLTIGPGEFVAIVGRSGSGKSTLLNQIGLLDRPTGGTYRLDGAETGGLPADARAALRRAVFGFVFQRPHLIAGASARENVEMPALYAGMPAAERRERAEALLVRLGLGHRLDHLPNELSGGQRQRVAIARAVMNGAGVILADEPTGALDEAAGREVLALLRELAAEGRTVILVTHDDEMARAADRLVEIRDGEIVADSGPAAIPAPGTAAPARRGREGRLPWREVLRGACGALGANRARTALTLLGIVIGAASVIAMLAIGEGAKVSVMERAAATGADWIVVLPDEGAPGRPGGRLTLADAEAVAELANVRAVNPGRWTTATLVAGGETIRSEVFASGADYVSIQNWPAARGAFFTEADARSAAPVAVLGASVAGRLFPDGAEPVGARVLIENIPFLVTGVLAAKGPDENGMDRDDRVVIPFATGASRISGTTDLGGLQVAVADTARLAETRAAVEALLAERHGAEDFFVLDMAALIASLAATRSAMSAQLALVAAISLVVGGVGVMNVMLMGVAERRREIALRMAVGARPRDIFRQFLAESGLLAAGGAAAGLVLGLAAAIGAALLFEIVVVLQPLPILLALAMATGVGLAFGLMPARRGAALDPAPVLAGE